MLPKRSKISETLRASRAAFVYVGLFSFLINMLMLTVPIYMLQIFDRVLSSQSYETLLYLTLIAIVALIVMGLLDVARTRILVRISRWLDNKLSPLALIRSADNLLAGDTYGAQSLKDVSTVRQFLGGVSIFPFFDAPWVPVYLLVVFLVDPVLGFIATGGAVILFVLAVVNEIVSRKPLSEANTHHIQNQYYIDSALNNSETIQAMGMLPAIVKKWFSNNQNVLNLQCKASDYSGAILAASKFFRLTLQLAILGVGAYFVITGTITAGAMIAASIITARALAPIQQSIGAWKHFLSAKQAYERLKVFIGRPEMRISTVELPKAKGNIKFENVFYVPPGRKKPILYGVSFSVEPGELVAVIGPSGAGKSTLARLLLGVWPPTNGAVRLDGASVYTWDRVDFGAQVGYLPQNAKLFAGTVKENIARMNESSDESVIKAAKLAGAHDMILHLPQGYDSVAGDFSLSGGQSQRIALARAFYGDPCLLVLDEPETSLDKEGEKSLIAALNKAKEKGITVLFVSQRPAIAQIADKILVLQNGRVQAFGNTSDVLQKRSPPDDQQDG